jgi:protein-disulfide isomerase
VNNKAVVIISSLAILVGLYFTGAHLYKGEEIKQGVSFAEKHAERFVRPHSPWKGAEKPVVTVVEFLDPECESCRKFHKPLKKIVYDYDVKVKFVIRYAPLHTNSKFAIKILHAAEKQGKYWQTLDLLFEHQPEWGNHHNPNPNLIWTLLPKLGLDMKKIRADIQEPWLDEIIRRDEEDGKALGVQQTPTFFVNGKPVLEFGPEHLKAAIDDELFKL